VGWASSLPSRALVSTLGITLIIALPHLGKGRENRVILSGEAAAGYQIWQRNHCQECHQIHGIGGMLGPDVTTIVSRRSREDMIDALQNGRSRMPKFEFDEKSCDRVLSFLYFLDRTSKAHERSLDTQTPVEFLFAARPAEAGAKEESAPSPEAVRGEGLLKSLGCVLCHVPFGTGRKGATDLTLAHSRVGERRIRKRLLNGWGPMPAFDFLTENQVADILSYLKWLGSNRSRLGEEIIASRQATAPSTP